MSRDPFAGYDAWLERPIQRSYELRAAFEDFCDAEGIDHDDPDARERYDEYVEGAAEAAAEARAEARADAAKDRYEREVW